MPDPHAINQDVRYPYAESATLGQRCRALADLLDTQQGSRSSLTGRAVEQWRGGYRTQFDQGHQTLKANATGLSGDLRALASDLDQSANWARAEQAARARAREDSKSILEKGIDALGNVAGNVINFLDS